MKPRPTSGRNVKLRSQSGRGRCTYELFPSSSLHLRMAKQCFHPSCIIPAMTSCLTKGISAIKLAFEKLLHIFSPVLNPVCCIPPMGVHCVELRLVFHILPPTILKECALPLHNLWWARKVVKCCKKSSPPFMCFNSNNKRSEKHIIALKFCQNRLSGQPNVQDLL